MPARTGARFADLRDIRHVMILMLENRSFDHYFGSLSGGGHVRKASHLSVYDNTLTAAPSIADFPAGFPGQYTVAPSRRIGAITTARDPSARAATTTSRSSGPTGSSAGSPATSPRRGRPRR
jgi:hypothetical protein